MISNQKKPYHGGLELMVFGSIEYSGVRRLCRINGILNTLNSLEIIENELDWVNLAENQLIF